MHTLLIFALAFLPVAFCAGVAFGAALHAEQVRIDADLQAAKERDRSD